MAKILSEKVDHRETMWIQALISLTKSERKETLGDFCKSCGITYRFLYQVISGNSSISEKVLNRLKQKAVSNGIYELIELKILESSLGMK